MKIFQPDMPKFIHCDGMSYNTRLLFSDDEVKAFTRDYNLSKNHYHLATVMKPICGKCETKRCPRIHRWFDECRWNTRYTFDVDGLPYCDHNEVEWYPKP